MRIDINRITPEGVLLEEDILASALDLETEIVNFCGPVKIKARVSKITNAITADLNVQALMRLICSRCLEEIQVVYQKKFKLNYPEDKIKPVIDLDPDIREEMILDYPIKPLCKPDCLGLCPGCGKNLNEGKCSC